LVHAIAPCPERSTFAMRASAQGAVKGVAVGVGHARDRETGQSPGIGGRGGAGRHRCDPIAVDLDRDAIADLAIEVPEPGELTPVRRHDPTRATNSLIRSTNAARWNRSNCSHVVNVRGSITRSRNSTPSR